jgi:hypothetical protein
MSMEIFFFFPPSLSAHNSALISNKSSRKASKCHHKEVICFLSLFASASKAIKISRLCILDCNNEKKLRHHPAKWKLSWKFIVSNRFPMIYWLGFECSRNGAFCIIISKYSFHANYDQTTAKSN